MHARALMFFLALLDVFNFFGGCNPTLRVDVVDGRLCTLSIVLREEPQVFFAALDFSPYALGQQSKKPDIAAILR